MLKSFSNIWPMPKIIGIYSKSLYICINMDNVSGATGEKKI